MGYFGWVDGGGGGGGGGGVGAGERGFAEEEGGGEGAEGWGAGGHCVRSRGGSWLERVLGLSRKAL